MACGIWVATVTQTQTSGIVVIYSTSSYRREMLSLALNLLVTFSTECIGRVHDVTLRYVLWHEGQMKYCTNLRLFASSSSSYTHHRLSNVIMGIFLILSYASSSLLFRPVMASTDEGIAFVFAVPTIVLGVSVTIQAIIACGSMSRLSHVFTWSPSPVDMAAALMYAEKYPPIGTVLLTRRKSPERLTCS